MGVEVKPACFQRGKLCVGQRSVRRRHPDVSARSARENRTGPTPTARAHATSYADIFYNNCFKNGLLPVQLPEHEVARLFDEVAAFVGYELTIDLEQQLVLKPDGSSIAFDVEPFRKFCLLGGFDDIGLTLRHADKIRGFEAARLLEKPWLTRRV